MPLTGDEVARAATDENGEERSWQETAAALQELVDKQLDAVRKARDVEWTRALLGFDGTALMPEQVKFLAAIGGYMTPERAAEWLEKDRVTRARNVADARQRRGPVRW